MCHREVLTEILSKEYYSRLSVLSYKYNKHSEWMTKPDHGGIKSPKTDCRGKLGMLGRGSSRADTQTTPRYCWGHTGGGSWGVKVPLSSGVFQASMEKSREGYRSLGIGSPVIWTSQELSVALAKLGDTLSWIGILEVRAVGRTGLQGSALGSAGSQSYGLTLATGVLTEWTEFSPGKRMRRDGGYACSPAGHPLPFKSL